jgi:hypothetical protein
MVSISMIDLITVVFREELPVLRLQAQSIARYFTCDDLGKIYIVVNDDTMTINQVDTNWWGPYQNRVVVVHRSAWNIDYAENGWLTQQLLKLMVTELCTNKWSMILDAKTIFVKSVSKIADRPRVGVLDIYPVFDVSRQRVNKLFNVDLQKQLGPGGVPFILDNSLTQEMILEIVALTDQSFGHWFQQQGMITEFILYAGYVLKKYGSYEILYDTENTAITPCNLCHSEVSAFDRKFKEMEYSTTVSIHRRAWAVMSAKQRLQYKNLLVSRDVEAAKYLE